MTDSTRPSNTTRGDPAQVHSCCREAPIPRLWNTPTLPWIGERASGTEGVPESRLEAARRAVAGMKEQVGDDRDAPLPMS